MYLNLNEKCSHRSWSKFGRTQQIWPNDHRTMYCVDWGIYLVTFNIFPRYQITKCLWFMQIIKVEKPAIFKFKRRNVGKIHTYTLFLSNTHSHTRWCQHFGIIINFSQKDTPAVPHPPESTFNGFCQKLLRIFRRKWEERHFWVSKQNMHVVLCVCVCVAVTLYKKQITTKLDRNFSSSHCLPDKRRCDRYSN